MHKSSYHIWHSLLALILFCKFQQNKPHLASDDIPLKGKKENISQPRCFGLINITPWRQHLWCWETYEIVKLRMGIALTCSPRTLRSFSRSISIWLWDLPNSTEALPRTKPRFWLLFPYLQQSSASFFTTGRNIIAWQYLKIEAYTHTRYNNKNKKANVKVPISICLVLTATKPSSPRTIVRWKCYKIRHNQFILKQSARVVSTGNKQKESIL